MHGKPTWVARTRAGAAVLVLACWLCGGRRADAQPDAPPTAAPALSAGLGALPPLPPEPTPAPAPAEVSVPAAAAIEPSVPGAADLGARFDDGSRFEVGCATCGGAGLLARPGGINLTCTSCGGNGCVPGRKKGSEFHYHTIVGRFFGNLYECLCCPDPCYEPAWVPEANAGFFLDYARPRTIQRVRYTHVNALDFPDRSEYFWARENLGSGSTGRGPGAPKGFKKFRGERSMDFDQLSFYQEAATARASVFVEIPYTATNPVYTSRHSGFSDMNVGTKALFFDCELLQLAFQFRTYIPIGNTTNGLGTGHVSLEPSLLSSLRLAPHTYLQGQLAEWIPIGGDMQYQSSILNYHFSLNHVLFNLAEDSPVIGTLEAGGWSFQSGSYTDPNPRFRSPARYGGNDTYFEIGPGLRASICNKIDFGGAVAFPVTEPNYGTWFRAEIRVLY